MQRKSVEIIARKRVRDGEACILFITYRDGRTSWAISLPGFLALEGAGGEESVTLAFVRAR